MLSIQSQSSNIVLMLWICPCTEKCYFHSMFMLSVSKQNRFGRLGFNDMPMVNHVCMCISMSSLVSFGPHIWTTQTYPVIFRDLLLFCYPFLCQLIFRSFQPFGHICLHYLDIFQFVRYIKYLFITMTYDLLPLIKTHSMPWIISCITHAVSWHLCQQVRTRL